MRRYDDVIIGADLDGTLYENQNNIPKQNLLKIKEFTDNGGKFAIATGRGIEAARALAKLLPTDTPAIVNNGHTLYDYKNEREIYSLSLPENLKEIVFDVLKRFKNVAVEIYSGCDLYVMNINETLLRHLNYEKVDYINACICDVDELKWNKVLLTDKKEGIDKVRDYLMKKPHDGLEFVNTSELYLEAVIAGVTKGTALLRLAEHFGIPRENTFSIGNFYNDIGLLQSAAHSAVVKGTPGDVAKYADLVCDKTADEGAVAEYIGFVENSF